MHLKDEKYAKLIELSDDIDSMVVTGRCMIHETCVDCPADDSPEINYCYKYALFYVAERIRQIILNG